MRKFFNSFFIIGALLSTMMIETSYATDLDVTVASRHMFRGTPQCDAIGLQSSLTVPLVENNLGATSFNLWGHVPITGTFSEIDFSLSQELGSVGTLSLVSQYYDGSMLEIDSHDIEVGLQTNFAGIGVELYRVVKSAEIEGNTYLELGYGVSDFDLFVGVGDGTYSDSGDFEPVNVGFTYEVGPPERTERGERPAPRWGDRPDFRAWSSGLAATFIYNPSTETPYFVVSKNW